jgi:hypothetical protein
MSVPAGEKLRRGKPRGFSALWRSYGQDLRGWVGQLAAGYGIAAALFFGGILAVFAAMAVGAVAFFHFLEFRYGTNMAFAALGCGLLALGAILLLAGYLVMSRRVAPLPRPERQFRAARQMLVGTTIARAVTALHDPETAKPDVTTQVLLGAAAILAMGWLVASHLGSTGSGDQVRR